VRKRQIETQIARLLPGFLAEYPPALDACK